MANAPQAIDYYAGERTLHIRWSADHVSRYPTKHLRVNCGCAVCVDERTGERMLDPATIPADIDIAGMSAVGNYAVKISWSDGHDTGLYSWSHLLKLCPCPACSGG